ncbi:MAG: type IX secretion system anionic LPS delivery protein PorZ [Flavipsychrobacter sp.]
MRNAFVHEEATKAIIAGLRRLFHTFDPQFFNMNIYRNLILSVSVLSATACYAQNKPIGYWESHLPYNTAVSVATDGNILYTASQQSFFTYNEATGEMVPYSKVEGMSDVGMSYVAYDPGTGTAILAYQNSDIDLFQNNTFYNIPDLKNRAVAGLKNINHIYTENGLAYISTDIGILVVDMSKREIKESYIFTHNSQILSIKGFSSAGNYFYAITSIGLYRVDKRLPDVQNFAVWSHMDSTHAFINITTADSQLFVSTADSIFTINTGGTLQTVYGTNNTINHIDPSKNGIWISEKSRTSYSGIENKLDASSYQLVDSFHPQWVARQAAELTDGSVWVADEAIGLCKRNSSNHTDVYVPNGPSHPASFDIYAYNKEVWVAHGGFNDLYRPNSNRNGFSGYVNGVWHTYTYNPYTLYNPMLDFVSITKNPVNGNIYAGSFQNGLYIMQPNGDKVAQLQNPPFSGNPNNGNEVEIAGLAFDQNNNLWVSLFGSPYNLVVRTPDSIWYQYSINTPTYPHSGGPIIFDDYGQKWVIGSDGGGIIVYNDNGTLENTADDQAIVLTSGTGHGNLPSNEVYSIAKDKNGDIWVGTNNGIGIINCAGSIFQGCDAQIPIVQYDQYAGYLFAGENVRSIAVDGANRKWVGTDNGVWLLSPDASKIVNRFTADNSPLPSNHTEKITIDPVTGDVYIGTDQGLVTYHGTATEGGTSNSNVMTYPNPVPSGYGGTIAIKGLVANGDVRITDMNGQLVYRTTALGGQAVWNGMDYTGHRPQSGVYLIFVSNNDGSQTYAGKMVFMQ